ncbi:histidinol-phosphate transaminase [Virgibacillus flavescens]|uniref:histidinol-phosphate transaminase n=1 Tax=Virgibacillus flavescens TaxID=1611422 RepID=UPI003D354CCD
MRWKKQMLNLKAYQPGKSIEEVKEQYQLNSIVKLASNENPYGYSPQVDQALTEFHSSFIRYPDGNASTLRKATASLLGVNHNQLIFTNGTDELVQIISRALLEPGKNTVMATPTFPQYKHNAVIEGAEIREVKLVNGNHDLNQMVSVIDENTAIVWVCSPNNPSGNYISQNELQVFLKRVPHDVLVILDEAYYEYVNDSNNSITLLDTFPNLLIMRTFSKIYGLASFRVGYGVSSAANVEILEPARPPFNTNVLGQAAATAAISDQDYIEKCRLRNLEEKEKYYTFCQENKLYYYPTHANFILIDFQCDGDAVAQFLLSNGLIVRSGKALGYPTCVRISFGLAEENERVREVLREFLEQRNYDRKIV